jgi:UTP-glucose-1-phosphate uridylyltransferase
MNFNIGKIYIRPANFITYRTIGAEYYSRMRKQIIENYNNKRRRVFVEKNPPKKGLTNYGSFQNIDKIKWSPASYVEEVVEMKPVKKQASSDDEWVDVKKSL